MTKKIALLGSTGSIGTQTLDIVKMHQDKFEIKVLAAGRNIDLLEEQIREFHPKMAVIGSKEDQHRLKSRLNTTTRILCGFEGIEEAINEGDVDLVLNALVGSKGLGPTCQAIQAGKDVALANKESLVSGGQLVMSLAEKHNVSIIPVDSEHSAIFQCLHGEKKQWLKKIILTASGGPFREMKKSQIRMMGVKEALNHPNWSMGNKITIDSATMMNKGLEIIEAAWLFNVSLTEIDVVVHPQSIIHSMVEFQDTSVIAQLGLPDMRVPIQYALSYPERLVNTLPSLSLTEIHTLTFEPIDENKFPCIRLAKEAQKIGMTMPCVLTKANDLLVEAFLYDKIGFYELSDKIETLMNEHHPYEYHSMDDLLEVEAWVESTLRV